jgi:hypothetical protein
MKSLLFSMLKDFGVAAAGQKSPARCGLPGKTCRSGAYGKELLTIPSYVAKTGAGNVQSAEIPGGTAVCRANRFERSAGHK